MKTLERIATTVAVAGVFGVGVIMTYSEMSAWLTSLLALDNSAKITLALLTLPTLGVGYWIIKHAKGIVAFLKSMASGGTKMFRTMFIVVLVISLLLAIIALFSYGIANLLASPVAMLMLFVMLGVTFLVVVVGD